jgi:uncharacterized SAM-binding protein YcdF (DUF218 family)
MAPKKTIFYRALWISIALVFIFLVLVVSGVIPRAMGNLVVADEQPQRSDAVVVLSTGIEYCPRLIQAAYIYRQGLANTVVINGNRKTDALRELEARGFQRCCPWYADAVNILTMYGVPEDRIIWISVEDAYDTVSEADIVGAELIKRNFSSLILTTSKYHTRRAKYIWKQMYQYRLTVYMVSAKKDPYDPNNWWADGRQIRWLLAEYGAWIYYWWKEMRGI